MVNWNGLLTFIVTILQSSQDFPGGSDSKVSAYNVGALGSIPGSGRSAGEGNGNPLQYSCLKNPTDGGAWWAIVHGVATSPIRLSDFTFFHFQEEKNSFLKNSQRKQHNHMLN